MENLEGRTSSEILTIMLNDQLHSEKTIFLQYEDCRLFKVLKINWAIWEEEGCKQSGMEQEKGFREVTMTHEYYICMKLS